MDAPEFLTPHSSFRTQHRGKSEMFYYLSGTVAHIEPYLAVIDCGGVGYACRTTS